MQRNSRSDNAPSARHPLDIWTWQGVYAASWGHHDATTFLMALADDFGMYAPTGQQVNRGWARIGFDGEGGKCVYHVEGPGRGVRPITEVDLT